MKFHHPTKKWLDRSAMGSDHQEITYLRGRDERIVADFTEVFRFQFVR